MSMSLCGNYLNYKDEILIVIVVSVVAVVVLTISEITANKLDVRQDTNVFDLRGTLRQRFGLIASLEKTDTSSVCSPISALLPLGNLALGAEGSSLQELNKAIGVMYYESPKVDNDQSTLLKYHLSSVTKDLEDLPGVTLNIANRLYVSDDKTLYTNYAELTESILKSSIETVNFKDPLSAADNINNWVSLKTRGMISNLLSPENISPISSLVVVNAIYFAGKWAKAFNTVDVGIFYSAGGPRVVDTMTNIEQYKYGVSDVLGAQLVEIPYVGNESSFLIVIPNEQNGLQRLLNVLKSNPDLLAKGIREMSPQITRLTMPKFKIESQWNLTALYNELGVNSIFDSGRSGLTGIVQNEQLYVSHAIQKAVIEVNEIGTKAAVSSAIIGLGYSPQLPLELNINHPFLFYVLANSQQLFTGTYN